jgi:hypothetical protein
LTRRRRQWSIVTPAALTFEVLDVLLGTKGKTLKYPLIQLQRAIAC